jgi:hypothetical protein
MSFDDIAEHLMKLHPEADKGKMFGMPVWKLNGKALGGEWKGDMVFKLVDEYARNEALKIEGAELFDPGMGRPMKEWVVVPAIHSDKWLGLAEKALKGMGG